MQKDRAALALAASAATLAATALGVRDAARRTERAHPPWGRFVRADGVPLHYIEAGGGSGPPVILLHGNGTMAQDWIASGVIARIAERHRVLAFDRPGYGYSQRPRDRLWTADEQARVLANAFARLGIERPIVVGHSWGTLVAIALGLDHEVAGLVLVSGYFFPTPRVDALAFSPPAIPVLGDVFRYTAGPAIGRLLAPRILRKIFAPHPVPLHFTQAMPTSMTLRPWQVRASAEDSGTMVPWAAAQAHRYPELHRLPVSILAGSEDQIADHQRHSVRLHEVLPHSDLQIVPGLGHMVHYGAAARVAEAVEAVASAPTAPRQEAPGSIVPSPG